VKSRRRTSSESEETVRTIDRRKRRRSRSASSLGALVLAAVMASLVTASPAAAQPPEDREGAARQLEQVQAEAETLTEEWHAARDTLGARESELGQLQAAVEPARLAVDQARAEEEQFRVQVDAMAMSTYESGNLDQLNALLESDSPQHFLDQMSALETLALEYEGALEQLVDRVDETARMQAEADAAVARAQGAADEAGKAAADVENRKREAERRIDEAEQLLERLTPEEERARLGPEVGGPGAISGSGVGVEAIRFAQGMLGKPYRWGAEGPNSFDCSGLTSWAFKRAGITLPRSSGQQARVGTPVSREELRPGDLVFFNQPVSHVGIYVGDGKMINAPQTGDVIKYSSIASRKLASARRL
jgi:peptidoglycan DL-endopeptidase CwlO